MLAACSFPSPRAGSGSRTAQGKPESCRGSRRRLGEERIGADRARPPAQGRGNPRGSERGGSGRAGAVRSGAGRAARLSPGHRRLRPAAAEGKRRRGPGAGAGGDKSPGPRLAPVAGSLLPSLFIIFILLLIISFIIIIIITILSRAAGAGCGPKLPPAAGEERRGAERSMRGWRRGRHRHRSPRP